VPRSQRFQKRMAGDQQRVRGQMFVFVLLYIAYIGVYFTRKPFSVAKSTLKNEAAHTESELGMIDTAFLFAYAVGQFSSGSIAGLVGTKMGLVLAFLGTGVCSCVFGSSESPQIRAAFWLANGVFQALFFPLIMDVLMAWFPPSARGRVFGLWTTSQQLGGFVTSAFGAYVLSQSTMSWRDIFVLPAYLSFLFALLCLTVLQTSPAEQESSKESQGTKGKPQSLSFVEVIFLPHLLNVGAAYFCLKLVRYTFLGWLPFYLTEVLQYSAADSVLMSTAFDLAGTAGSVACGFISDK